MFLRLAFPALLLFAPPVQQEDDLETRLGRLLKMLGGDDIVAVDDAQIEVLKAGPSALPFLNAKLPSLADDLKLRVEGLIRRIERAEKARVVMGSPALVTLEGERPVREHLEELKRQSGQPIEIGEVGDARVSLDLRNVPHWTAIDEVCRRHGRIDWRFGEETVRVLPGAYRARPLVVRGQFAFLIDHIAINQTYYGTSSHGTVMVNASFAWTRSSNPGAVKMEVTSFVDDKGTSLVNDGVGIVVTHSGDPGTDRPSGAIRQPLVFQSQVMPGKGATCFELLKGRLTAKFVLEVKKLASLESPTREGVHQAEVGERGRFTVRNFSLSGRSLSAQAELTQTYDGQAALPVEYVATGKDGTTVRLQARATSTSTSIGPSGRSMTQQLDLSATVPVGFEIASVDLVSPSDSEELEIPFEFKAIKIQ